MRYQYHAKVIEQLARHGVRPLPMTSPQTIRDYLSDLYRYEIRKLRDRLLAKEFPKAEYAGRVDSLRTQYWLLGLQLDQWIRRT
jgi:hypothetical protein